MVSYAERLQRFQQVIAGSADLAFIPMTTDLDFLTGLHRDIPNYGRALHPGGWLEGAWFAPDRTPVLTLSRMSAELDGLGDVDGLERLVLGEWDDPAVLVNKIIAAMSLPAAPRIAISDNAEAEALIELQRILPDARFISATALLRPLRLIKGKDEIEVLRTAGRITEAALQAALGSFRLGMSELEVVAELDYQMKSRGSLGPSFTTTLYCTGPGHPWLPGQRLESWKRLLLPPVSVLLDFGAVHDGMCYDYGRTVSFGAPSAEQLRVHQVIMASQRAGIAALGVDDATCEAVDEAARRVVVEAGYGAEFRHRLGHGIGWDVHEPPFLTRGDSTPLREGMIFTVEPSIVQRDGCSARVEDCVVVRPGGGEPLTAGFQDLLVVD